MRVMMDWDEDLDTSGLKCPLPVLKARKRLQSMQPGMVLRMTATDPASAIDVPHFCNETGHELLHQEKQGENMVFLIRHR